MDLICKTRMISFIYESKSIPLTIFRVTNSRRNPWWSRPTRTNVIWFTLNGWKDNLLLQIDSMSSIYFISMVRDLMRLRCIPLLMCIFCSYVNHNHHVDLTCMSSFHKNTILWHHVDTIINFIDFPMGQTLWPKYA